jgi:uncharacterized membrane protein
VALAAQPVRAGPFFDAKILWWTGLGTFEPPSNDYQPLLPWLAVVLLGVAAGTWLLRRGQARGDESDHAATGANRESQHSARDDGVAVKSLAFFGRHSLVFYLVHQPLLFGFFALLALFAVSPGQERLFVRQCAEQCFREAAEPDLCDCTCTCSVARAQAGGYWTEMNRDSLTDAQKARAHDDIVACFGDSRAR